MKARLQITAGCKNDKTFLKHCFFNQPFKIGNITEGRSANLLKLMIMSSSPGILDNDEYEIKIELEENAELQITTQGYQRIFSMQNGASQVLNVVLESNACLYYLPHPSVPHKQASYSSVNNIFLQKKHHLIWSEIITCGRKLSGEKFIFTKFHNITNIYLEGRLLVKEIVLLEPLKTNLLSIGQMEGYTHQSTLVFLKEDAEIENLIDKCRQFLSGNENIEYGISALAVNGFIVRLLGYKGEQLFNCHIQLTSLIKKHLEPLLSKILLPNTAQ